MSEPESRPLDKNNNNAALSGSSHNSNSRPKKENNLKQDGAATDSGQYPHRPGEPNCMYFLRTGSCGYGNNCRYNHPTNVCQDSVYEFGSELPERDGEPDCEFFLKTGACKFGLSCKYNHPKDRNGALPDSFNILGLPIRPEENPCMFYMRTGKCKYGPACKFDHPQPAVSGPVYQVNGTGPLGYAQSSGQLISVFPALPIPAAGYVYDPQAYIPIPMGVPPAHDFVPHHYAGNMGPVSSNYSNRSSPEPPYPERPDRPKCRYFMIYGTCKYGQDCKYNHPKERVAQILPHPLNSPGLPINSGQPLCPSYITYGICQNGPACKFRHHIGGFPMNYGFSPITLPLPMPIVNQPLFGTTASTAVISSETSSPSQSSKDVDSTIKPESSFEENQHWGTNGQQGSHEEGPTTEENQHSGTNGQQASHEEEEPATEGNHRSSTYGQQKLNKGVERSRNSSSVSHAQI